jgi:ubiquinol-cytochrome c reductase cytochrome c subunit
MRRSVLTLAILVLLAPAGAAAQDGKQLFQDGCSSCHALDGGGIPGVGPSLRDAGPAAVDFYLSTGRMPLDDPREQPLRKEPEYTPQQIGSIAAYVESLAPGRGEPIPDVHPERGSLSTGMKAFTSYCAGCHQILGRGGVVVGASAPPLTEATARQVAEAVRVGPHLMPPFGKETIDAATLDSIVRYVEWAKEPDDRGGWSIGHIGPVPEGLVAWLLAGAVLVLVARVLGERAE